MNSNIKSAIEKLQLDEYNHEHIVQAREMSPMHFYTISINEFDDVVKSFYYLDKDSHDPIKIRSFIMTEASDKMNIPVTWLEKYDYAELQEEADSAKATIEDVITWLIEEWQSQ